MLRVICSVIILCSFLLCSQAIAAGDANAGKVKAQTCAACHGQNGISPNSAWPNLAGQNATYMVDQLLEFQKGAQGKRNNPIMTGIVASMSQQDFEDIAAYYSQLKPNVGAVSPSLLAHGEQLYRAGDPSKHIPACIACHGPTGQGNDLAKFPALSGQNAVYIMNELLDYQQGTRKTDPNHIMQDIASRLSKQDMQALASYISGLH